jgi:putative endonuclease
MNRRDTGILGERLARDNLKKRGYQILETNYRCPHGEIDIVATHRGYLVFVEVRTKRSREYGSPEESVTNTKKENLRATARHYRQNRDNLPALWRIDFMAVELGIDGKPSRIELIENAVDDE